MRSPRRNRSRRRPPRTCARPSSPIGTAGHADRSSRPEHSEGISGFISMAARLASGGRWRAAVVGVVLAALAVEAGLIGTQLGDGAAFGNIHWGWLAAAV